MNLALFSLIRNSEIEFVVFSRYVIQKNREKTQIFIIVDLCTAHKTFWLILQKSFYRHIFKTPRNASPPCRSIHIHLNKRLPLDHLLQALKHQEFSQARKRLLSQAMMTMKFLHASVAGHCANWWMVSDISSQYFLACVSGITISYVLCLCHENACYRAFAKRTNKMLLSVPAFIFEGSFWIFLVAKSKTLLLGV